MGHRRSSIWRTGRQTRLYERRTRTAKSRLEPHGRVLDSSPLEQGISKWLLLDFEPRLAANQDELSSCAWLGQVSFELAPVLWREMADDLEDTAALTRSGQLVCPLNC
jgi:hypothetical protein